MLETVCLERKLRLISLSFPPSLGSSAKPRAARGCAVCWTRLRLVGTRARSAVSRSCVRNRRKSPCPPQETVNATEARLVAQERALKTLLQKMREQVEVRKTLKFGQVFTSVTH